MAWFSRPWDITLWAPVSIRVQTVSGISLGAELGMQSYGASFSRVLLNLREILWWCQAVVANCRLSRCCSWVWGRMEGRAWIHTVSYNCISTQLLWKILKFLHLQYNPEISPAYFWKIKMYASKKDLNSLSWNKISPKPKCPSLTSNRIESCGKWLKLRIHRTFLNFKKQCLDVTIYCVHPLTSLQR